MHDGVDNTIHHAEILADAHVGRAAITHTGLSHSLTNIVMPFMDKYSRFAASSITNKAGDRSYNS